VLEADDVDAGPVDLAAASEALRRARVGGAFWAAPSSAGGEGDPWTAAEGAAEVRAEADDPLALVAHLLGRRVLTTGGTARSAAEMDDALRRSLEGRAWIDPFTGAPTTLLATIELLGDWRRALDANRRIGVAAGMTAWKRDAVARFLWDGRSSPPFRSPADAIAAGRATGRAVACWPSRVGEDMEARARAAGVPIAWVEDGFLRSNGLGADLRAPGSIAVDFSGLHFDPAGPSDLETLLATHPFSPALLRRARALRERIVAGRIGKYGVSRGEPPALPQGRRIALAIGQVSDDLSVRRAGAGVPDDLALLERVRGLEPDAFLVYRPHPDVVAGHREGRVDDARVRRWADRVEADGDLLSLVERADAVHVLSSLTGFEALMRGREVVVHGLPFYAGWGLTRDLATPPARRGRKLELDALVAAALILYPRYLDPVTQLPCPPELLVERIAAGQAAGHSWLVGLRRAQGRLRRGLAKARATMLTGRRAR
jgi:capsular polysaccharide export protein